VAVILKVMTYSTEIDEDEYGIYRNIRIDKGDIIYDTLSGDIGLVLTRFDAMDDHRHDGDESPPLFAWNILWAGQNIVDLERMQAYTEIGLKILIHSATFKHYKNI